VQERRFQACTMAGRWLCPLLVFACTRPNPAYDDGQAEGSSGANSAGTSGGSSSAGSDGGAPSTSAVDMDGDMDGGGTTTTGAPPLGESSTGFEPSSTSTGARIPTVHVFNPDLAECIHPPMPDPVACAAVTDEGFFQIDGDEPKLGGEALGVLRFQVGGGFEAAAVESVVLRMVAHPFDPGSSVGDIWEVAPFTYRSLFMDVPAQLGGAPIAPSAGVVDETLIVEWSLPPSVVVPNQPLHLSISTDLLNGVDYNDETSAMPPELIVTVQ
jgi:hypothetical protein